MEIHSMDWMYDNDFMTYNQLIERLRADLNSPDFFAFDLAVPHNEEEYLECLAYTRKILEIMRSRKDTAPTIDIDKQG